MPSQFSSVFTPKFSGPVGGATVEITLDQIGPALEALSEAMVSAILNRAALEGVKEFVPVAQEYAPVLTGWLRDHIHAEEDEEAEELVGSASFGLHISEVPYCWYQEYGTMRNAAHSYMRPAIDNPQARERALRSAGEALQRYIADIVATAGSGRKRGVA